MTEKEEEIYNKVCDSLINLEENNKSIKYDELFSLYDSVNNTQPNKKSLNFKISFNKNQSPINDYKKKNLINNIIYEKMRTYRSSFNHIGRSNFVQSIKNEEIKIKNNKDNNNQNKTFVTNACTNTEINIKPSRNLDKLDKDISCGKSLNEILTKSINNEMINKGILIQKPLSLKNNIKSKTFIKFNNYNNYEMHMKTFSKKIKKDFGNYITEYELAQKKSLRNISKKIADKKDKIIKNIPIYIKGYKKDPIDIFHSRKIFDLEYQKHYSKPCINIDDVLHYQNKTGDNNFKKKKTPFYFYLRTVNNPFDKKYLVKKGLPGSFRIKFCDLKFI